MFSYSLTSTGFSSDMIYMQSDGILASISILALYTINVLVQFH